MNKFLKTVSSGAIGLAPALPTPSPPEYSSPQQSQPQPPHQYEYAQNYTV